MYIRLTRTLADKGKLVSPEQVKNLIDTKTDWYYSPFTYGEDALEYFKEHNNSIKGYTGNVYTKTLYWDIDSSESLEKGLSEAKKLIDFLIQLGFENSIELYFSGSKGFHILLHTSTEFTPIQTSKICQNIANEAQIDKSVLDAVVYNVNRIFRVPNTVHPVTKLYKTRVAFKEEDLNKILENAKSPKDIQEVSEIEASFLIDKYSAELEFKVADIIDIGSKLHKFNPLDCPPGKRLCIYAIEQGNFGKGERENATIRLAAYYKGNGMAREAAFHNIVEALNKRQLLFPDSNKWTESDINRNLDQVYSPSWNGGTYSCRTDDYLRSKCDVGEGPCFERIKENKKLNVVTIKGLVDQYVQYSNEALREYPRFGLPWLDDNIRVRPRNFSIVNGANGCVDADTECLTPDGWIRIADWNGQEVLQYNPLTEEASFTSPNKYIKLPCSEMWHFKNNSGLDQMLSDEHKVLYIDEYGETRIITAKELADSSVKREQKFKGFIPSSFKLTRAEEKLKKLLDLDTNLYTYRSGESLVVQDVLQDKIYIKDLISIKKRTIDGFKYCFTVPTGFLVLRRNNRTFITGNSGKTSFVIQFIESLNVQKINHIFFSLDMANTSLFEKLGSKYTNYSQNEIERAFNAHTRDKKIMNEVIDVITSKLPYTLFDFTSSASSKHIENTIVALKEHDTNPIDIQVAFIDYAGRVSGDKENDFAQATANALAANDIAKRSNCHLMYISQIPREDGDHTKPLYSSRVSKNSGAWEENATFCINVWRTFGDGLEDIDNYINFYIAKNRSGKLGEQVFHWEGVKGNIRVLSEPEYIQYSKYCEQHDRRNPPIQFAGNHILETGKARLATPSSTKIRQSEQEHESEEVSHNNESEPVRPRFGSFKKS